MMKGKCGKEAPGVFGVLFNLQRWHPITDCSDITLS